MSRPNDKSFRKSNLCVVGNINRDIRISPLPPGRSLFRDGETPASSMTETIGGGGANSSCAAAALGARVAFLGKVGADPLGALLEKTLTAHGVVPHLKRDKAHSTGTSIALTFNTGHRHFISHLPNNASLSLSDLDLQVLSKFSHLLRADIWFSEAMLFGGNERLFKTAHESGLSVSLDLNWDPLWGIASPGEIKTRKEAVRALLPWVHVAHGNIRELQEFTVASDLPTALRRLEKWGVSAVVVHMGSKGAGYYQKGKLVIEPPVLARKQVNTTGTGDVLSICVMLLSQYSRLSVRQQLRRANRVVSEYIEGKRSLIPSL